MKNPKYLLDEPKERNLSIIFYLLKDMIECMEEGKKLGNKLPFRILCFLLKRKRVGE